MKIDRDSLATKIFKYVKNEILEGNIKQGEKISEENLATQFGTSRSPVREAMLMLQEYGLIILAPRSHASVIHFSEQDIQDFNNLRFCLESFAISLLTKQQINAMQAEIENNIIEIEKILAEDRAKSFEFDSLFHLLIVKSTDNMALFEAYKHIEAKIQLLRIEQYISPTNFRHYIQQHKKIYSLLQENKKDECKRILYDHIHHKTYAGYF